MARQPQPTKLYRLLRGTHSVPNPDALPEYAGDPEAMHRRAQKGDLVPLTDEQYKSFKDKFAPAESDASDVKSADDQVLEDAKASAATTGQSVNPNVPSAPPRATTPPKTTASGATA